MPDWRREIGRRLSSLGLAPLREVEITEELTAHLEDRYRELLSRGVGETDARAAAWHELEENDRLARELVRTETVGLADRLPLEAPRRNGWLDAFQWDLAAAVRRLGHEPLFTLTVVAALALSIGPTTAVVSFGNWLFWRPLPQVAAPDRLGFVEIAREGPHNTVASALSSDQLATFSRPLTTSAGLAGVQEYDGSLLVGTTAAHAVGIAVVTGNFFDVLGTPPTAGRTLRADDDRGPLGTPVVVLSDGLARGAFGSPAAAVGQSIRLNRQPFRVIGVAPAGFSGDSSLSHVDVWLTGATQTYLDGSDLAALAAQPYEMKYVQIIARLAPGASFHQLEAELTARARALGTVNPSGYSDLVGATARVWPGLRMQPQRIPLYRTEFQVLLAIAGTLLLLGCANISNLLLARAISRDRDIAVRRALGASAWRLVQLPLVEACLLAFGGAAVGLGLAYLLKGIIEARLFPTPWPTVMPLDSRVLLVTATVAVAVGLTAGLGPAWLSARGRLVPSAGAVPTPTTRAPRLRSALAAGQLGLSLALLIGALLLISTLRNLHAVDLGFDPTPVSTFRLNPSREKYDGPRTVAFEEQLVTGLAARREFLVAAADRAPFQGRARLRLLDGPFDSTGVTATYFQVLGISVVEGRTFTDAEAFATAPTTAVPVLVNQTMARQVFGDAEPLGQTLQTTPFVNLPSRDLVVVGVVADVRAGFSLADPPLPIIYQPLGRYTLPHSQATVIVRTTAGLAEVAQEVRKAVAGLDPDFPVGDGRPLAADIEQSVAEPRLFSTMLTWVSALALVLAAVGLYGLLSQATAERAREFGVRLAIGASPVAIVRLVAGRVVVVSAGGVGFGLALAALGSRYVATMLFGVTPLDPSVYGLAVALLCAVVTLASAGPAFRATRVPVLEVLRAD